MQAAPERLDDFASAGRQMVADLDRSGRALGRALDGFRESTGRAEFLADVPPLDVDLRDAAERIDLLAQLTASIAGRLRDLDAEAEVVESGLDLPFLLGVTWDLLRLRGDQPAPEYDPERWLAHPAGEQALAEVRALLDPGWFGVSANDLAELQALFEQLPPVIADAVIHGLSDDELERLVAATGPSRIPGRGLDAHERHELWTTLGSKISLVSYRRLAALTDDLDPPPATALDDSAADRDTRQEWYDALVYHPFDGWLTWQGEGDPHAISRNDTTQGRIGNCYLIAALMGVADHDPALLERMITPNPNGTFTVTFADGMRVVVSPDLPVHPDDPTTPVFAGNALDAEHYDPPAGRLELWPVLLEKAYAQRHEGWGETAGGWPGEAITELVGGETSRLDPTGVTPDDLAVHHDAGRVVTFATRRDVEEAGQELYDRHRLLTGGHAYVVTDIHDDGRIELHNPWQAEHSRPLTITQEEMAEIGWHLEVNELP